MACDTCSRYKRSMTCDDWDSTLDDLLADMDAGVVRHISGDCTLEETKDHIYNETRFSVIHNFRCACGTRIEWGVCIRGTPLLRLHPD